MWITKSVKLLQKHKGLKLSIKQNQSIRKFMKLFLWNKVYKNIKLMNNKMF